MRLTRQTETRSTRTSRPRRQHAPAERPEPRQEAAPTPGEQEQQRHKRSGGPLDAATYHCACGMVFEARVSTSVSCPHCGDSQAW